MLWSRRLLWGGKSAQILAVAREKRVMLYTSPALLAELEEVLARGKFAERIAKAGSTAEQLVSGYLALAQVVKPVSVVPVVIRDPDDDQVLACALTAQADIIVSGDKDLLDLGSYQSIPILTAVQSLERIRALR